uniref:Uncharacterized protein n=1 Tax=Neovison vison TaxID=452646 RepID=A0A8C7A1J1_NEOVI
MLDLVVYLSLNKCFLPFNVTVNSSTRCSVCLICFFLMFHMKTTNYLNFSCVSSL